MTIKKQNTGSKLGEGIFYALVAMVFIIIVWYPLTIPLKGFLDPPHQVASEAIHNLLVSDTYVDIWLTIRRILMGFIGSMLLGIGLGIWMGNKKAAEAFFLPWVAVALAIPGPVYIVMSILILGINESSTLIALVVSITPFVTNIIYQGVRSMDPKLNQMSQLYRMNKRQHLKEVVLPQITPSILASVRTGFSIAWKEVVILEALSQPRGIGSQILHYFKLLQPDQVLAWTFTFTLIMFLIEFLVFRRMENQLLRWRRREA